MDRTEVFISFGIVAFFLVIATIAIIRSQRRYDLLNRTVRRIRISKAEHLSRGLLFKPGPKRTSKSNIEGSRCLRRPCFLPTCKSALDCFTFEIGCSIGETSVIDAVEGLYIYYRISSGSDRTSGDWHDPASAANVKIRRLRTKTIAVQLSFVTNNQTKATVWMRSPNSFVFRAEIARAGSDRNYRPAGRPFESEPQIATMATPIDLLGGTWLGHSGHSIADQLSKNGEDSTRAIAIRPPGLVRFWPLADMCCSAA